LYQPIDRQSKRQIETVVELIPLLL